LEIRHVEGAGGDAGLDLFVGKLNDRPAIWQCKHFPNGLGVKQRPQVKKSLRTALENFKPIQWVLVVSVDLDTKGHQWFQKLKQSYASKTGVGLFQASDIVRELTYRRNLREVFFPGAVFDSLTVNRFLRGQNAPTSAEPDRLTDEGLDSQIARLEQQDARFNVPPMNQATGISFLASRPLSCPTMVAPSAS
jgi:hypothetical protein